ncbi:tyrosyl-DNA phosphodiesterase 1-like [Oratosquilla oratoria]|uniref:tyrosyl-DNA phosphodiesterase 1-like n=1 Tax=Oratosquilla oratoria TaxID=337810 RepID=UPI003F76126F
MNADEEFARKLQLQFDAEFETQEKQMKEDAILAQKLAARSHNLSDSDEDDVIVQSTMATTSSCGTVKLSQNEKCSETSLHSMSDSDADNDENCGDEQVKSLATNSQADRKVNNKPPCKYGAKCYRKNPEHLKEFYHPGKDEVEPLNSEESKKEFNPPPLKKRKYEDYKSRYQKDFAARHLASAPFYFFLNKAYSVKETHEDPLTLVFPDLLSNSLGDIVESLQLTFMVDLEFVMKYYKKAGLEGKPVLIMYGIIEGQPSDYQNLTCKKVDIPIQYGTHHTKMMIFLYTSGIRVVIHTANLVEDDWYEKTQGYWVSPVFPPLGNGKSSLLEGESPTQFKQSLVNYLLAYKVSALGRWANIVKGYDFSSCNVMLIASVPGYHTGETMHKWGHMKARRAIKSHAGSCKNSLPIVMQCSSIGSLGKDAKSWLSSELGISLAPTFEKTASQPKVDIVYPSEEEVRTSSQGYLGGSCLPFNMATYAKQMWMDQHFHLWRSEGRKRSKSMPHIKTYTRPASPDYSSVLYFMLTSANISKAAWGQLQKQNTQLFIRSYEVGVLFLPKFIIKESEFKVTYTREKNCLCFPYDMPPTSYPSGTRPWLMGVGRKKPDVFGITL